MINLSKISVTPRDDSRTELAVRNASWVSTTLGVVGAAASIGALVLIFTTVPELAIPYAATTVTRVAAAVTGAIAACQKLAKNCRA